VTTYRTTDVADLLGMSAARVRRLARTAGLDPDREAGGRYGFGFRDLVLLKTAVALEESGITPRRLLRSIRALGEQLPADRPLTAVRIMSETGAVVAVDRDTAWDVESGQTRLPLDRAEDTEERAVSAISARRPRRQRPDRKPSPEEWFDLGCALQAEQSAQAEQAFRNALAGDPSHADAAVNLGYLLHEREDAGQAEAAYRQALAAAPTHPTAAFNLAVALEDQDQADEALQWYLVAIEADPLMADAYYNLSRLCEERGDRAAALRYLRSYSELVRIN
jgi:tetratricopeptide (TPR) repeat protein